MPKDRRTTELNILEEIDKNDHITPTEIAEKLEISIKHAITTIRKLEDGGFIVKKGNYDKRKQLLFLTHKGNGLLKALRSVRAYFIKD